MAAIPGAQVKIANAPAIPGLGSTGGFTFEIQDLNDRGVTALSEASNSFIKAARERPELAGVYTTFDDAMCRSDTLMLIAQKQKSTVSQYPSCSQRCKSTSVRCT